MGCVRRIQTCQCGQVTFCRVWPGKAMSSVDGSVVLRVSTVVGVLDLGKHLGPTAFISKPSAPAPAVCWRCVSPSWLPLLQLYCSTLSLSVRCLLAAALGSGGHHNCISQRRRQSERSAAGGVGCPAPGSQLDPSPGRKRQRPPPYGSL